MAGILTEGYFVEYNSGATFVNHNEQTMNRFSEKFYNIFHRNNTNKDHKVFLIHKHEKEQINKYLDYGKSEFKFIPDIMMGMTKESTRDFLSFMLNAEGGCSQSGQFEFSSKSPKMIKQVQYLLLRFGVRKTL